MNLYYFLFGYVSISVKEEDRASAVTALIRRGLSAKFSKDGEISVPYFKRKRYENALKNIPYEISASGGIPVIFLNNKRRYGIFAGLMFVIVFHMFTSFFVWDIRVSGNEKVSDSVILEELASVGFEVGSSWDLLSLNKVENSLLQSSGNIGWININRRGKVAYVTVKEKTVYEAKTDELAFSNVVASCDSVIEEITVRSGIACVKVGDTVKAGDLLISGVIPGELGGGFVRADGDVFGRVNEEISVEIPRTEQKKSYEKEELCEVKLKIFKFTANIFKKYRKIDIGCAIIEDVKECTVFGKYRIPIRIERIYVAKAEEKPVSYTDSELLRIAAARLADLRLMRLADAELMKIRTNGEFTDAGYKMTSRVTVLRDIGETRYFGEPKR